MIKKSLFKKFSITLPRALWNIIVGVEGFYGSRSAFFQSAARTELAKLAEAQKVREG